MKYTRRLKKRKNSTYRKKQRGGNRYIVPKKDQYEFKGTKYFKLVLGPEAEVVEFIGSNQPAYWGVTLRGLTLDKQDYKYIPLDTLKAIVKHIIKEEPSNKRKDIIKQILDNIELE